MTHQQRDYDCRIAGTRVTIHTQLFHLSGLSNGKGSLQREFGCSAENACPHRSDPNCPRRQLQAKADRQCE